MDDVINKLNETGCAWRIERIAPTTSLCDTQIPRELRDLIGPSLQKLSRGGSLFRCRIGRGRYVLGDSFHDAANGALRLQKPTAECREE